MAGSISSPTGRCWGRLCGNAGPWLWWDGCGTFNLVAIKIVSREEDYEKERKTECDQECPLGRHTAILFRAQETLNIGSLDTCLD